MAATLASVCSVPLASVLHLFELTKDYRILLPLMVDLFPELSFVFICAKKWLILMHSKKIDMQLHLVLIECPILTQSNQIDMHLILIECAVNICSL